MARLATAGVFALVVSFFVLPLYEFADIGEHWPHDGDYVAMILTVLFFVGLTLILRRSTSAASRGIVASQCRASGRFEPAPPEFVQSPREPSCAGPHRVPAFLDLPHCLIEAPRFLVLQDFRI
ncbi:MAG TPA: hypothetical protein VGZ27_16455 [Vicinamibacterales bacterium]|jgi:hypothetical protein|nr:hypothetical protein [Vicinamibacterales bacterium]